MIFIQFSLTIDAVVFHIACFSLPFVLRLQEMKVTESTQAALIAMMICVGRKAVGKSLMFGGLRELPGAPVEDVMEGAAQVAESHLAGCDLVLVSPDRANSLGLVHR